MDDDVDRLARARVASVLDDKWTLERLLGIGGMAAVYAACHRNGARAAVKVLHPHLSRHQEVRERFQREGYAANQVGHPGAVKVFDDGVASIGPEAGAAYIVMELLEGQSMQDRLERGPSMSELEFLQIADRVLDVLRAAHARGVVHRDLKPENLFLVRPSAVDDSPGARVKVLDFGLARLVQGQAITAYGLALGTPSFMSPEQAAGRLDEIDGRTDLFALAATGFRLRTGRRIHEGANAVELVTKMASLPAPPIRTMAADVSVPFARVIDRALAYRRDERYRAAADMQSDVRRAMVELDGIGESADVAGAGATKPGWTPDEARQPTVVELSARHLEPASWSESGAPARRRPRKSILPWVAAVLFTAIGGGLWFDSRAVVAPRSVAPPPTLPTLSASPPRLAGGSGKFRSGPGVAPPTDSAASAGIDVRPASSLGSVQEADPAAPSAPAGPLTPRASTTSQGSASSLGSVQEADPVAPSAPAGLPAPRASTTSQGSAPPPALGARAVSAAAGVRRPPARPNPSGAQRHCKPTKSSPCKPRKAPHAPSKDEHRY